MRSAGASAKSPSRVRGDDARADEGVDARADAIEVELYPCASCNTVQEEQV